MVVRELLTKLGFKVDKSGVNEANKMTNKLKQDMNKVGDAGKQAGTKASQGLGQISPAASRSASSLRGMIAAASVAGGIIRNAMNAARSAVDEVSNAATRAGNKMKNLSSKKIAEKSGKITSNGAEFSMAGAAVLAPVALPLKQAINFESAMADVRKVVDFDTPEQFAEMGDSIQNMTKYLPMAAIDLAKIVAAGGQSGIEKENLLEFAEAAAKMGVAFDITADQAGDMMAKWRTAFKMSQPEVEELADKVNYLGNKTAASAPLISDVVRRIGPLGTVGGVASGEIAALGASLVGSGVDSEVAATGIKNMILALVAGDSATKSQTGAFLQLGFEASNMAERMQVDAKGAIRDVFMAIKGLDKAKQMSVMKELFGNESLAAIGPLLSNLDNLQHNFDLVADRSNYAGSMQSEFDARCETTANSLELVKNVTNIIGNNLGKTFLPTIKEISKSLMVVGDKVIDFIGNNQGLSKFILFAVAGFGILLVVLGTLGILLGGVMTLIGTLAPIFTAVFTAISAAALPMIAVIAAIAAMIYICKNHWEAVCAMFAPGLATMMDGLSMLAGAWYNIQPLIQALMPLIGAIVYIIGIVLVGAVRFVWNLFVIAFTAIATVINTVAFALGKVGDFIQWVAGGLAGLIDKVKNFLGLQGQMNTRASGNDVSGKYFSNSVSIGSISVPSADDVGPAAYSFDTPDVFSPYS